MNFRKSVLATIILLVVINGFKAEKPTNLDEHLEKLTLISHLLNSIAIRNGFHSGYPNIHTGIAEILKMANRNSLLKFLDVDIGSTMKLFTEFQNYMDKIGKPVKDESDGMLKLIRILSWLKRYHGRLTAEKFDKAKEEIDKYQGTMEGVEKNIKFIPKDYIIYMHSLLYQIVEAESTEQHDKILEDFARCFSFMKYRLVEVLKTRKKLKSYFDLKTAVKTFRIFLELSKDLSEVENNLKKYATFVNDTIPSLSSWSSELNPQLSIKLRNFIQTLTQLIPAPDQNKLSISFVETENVENKLLNDWFQEAIVKNHDFENLNVELKPVFEFFDTIFLMSPGWENEVIENFGPLTQNFTQQADQIFEAVKYGKQLFDIQEEVDIQCLQGFRILKNFDETKYQSYKNHLEYLERKLNGVDEKVQKLVFDVPDSVFEMVMKKLEPVNVIVQDATLNNTEKWDSIQEWRLKSPEDLEYSKESLSRILDSLKDLAPSTVTPATPPNIIFPLDSFKALLKSTNISEVVNCTDESSLPKLDKLVNFLKNVHAIKGAEPKLSNTAYLLERAGNYQTKIKSAIEEAEGSEKSRVQGIQNIQKTAEDVSHGVRSLRNIQILLQNFDSITNLTDNLQNLPSFNNDDQIKLVYLWRELQDYNTTLASFSSDSNFSDLWSTVFGEATKIRNIDFIVEHDLGQIEQVFSSLAMSENRDKIRVASNAFKEVEAILERALGPEEEEEEEIGNTIKEGFTAQHPETPFKPSFAYNLFKIYYLEMLFVLTIVSFPLGFWLYERSKEIILNSN